MPESTPPAGESAGEPSAAPTSTEAPTGAPDATPAPTGGEAQPVVTAPPAADGSEGEAGVSSIAQNSTTGQNQPKAPPKPPTFAEMLQENWIWVVLLGAMWILVIWNSRKSQQKKAEQKQREAESLQKGAKVVTIGGLHGAIVAIDENQFTIKPDSNNGLTLTFDRRALARVVSDEQKTAQASTS